MVTEERAALRQSVERTVSVRGTGIPSTTITMMMGDSAVNLRRIVDDASTATRRQDDQLEDLLDHEPEDVNDIGEVVKTTAEIDNNYLIMSN